MRLIKIAIILSFILLGFSSATAQTGNGSVQDKVIPLTEKQQKELLSGRMRSGAITGTFDSYTSLLFALNDIAMHTEDGEINDTRLNSPFPAFYKPTVRQLFDTIALQTRSSWKYDAQRDYWVFAKPAIQKPYFMTLADKWTSRDMGIYTGYAPATFPSGMDVYYYGIYSSEDKKREASLRTDVRNLWALNFASNFKRGVTLNDMTKLSVDGVEALYFETPAPRPGIIFREWVFNKQGKMFVIISTLPATDKQAVSDVEAMVRSFRVTD